ATLMSVTPGVIITQPGTSAYADMPMGSSGGNNLKPFTFTLDPTLACGQSANFTLTVNYVGGPPRALNFTVQTGLLSITTTLGTKPTAPAGITTGTGTQNFRLNRNGLFSSCGSTKAFPGSVTSVPTHVFDSYTFTGCQAGCLNVGLSSPTSGFNIFESIYSPSFDPTNIATNYQGDAGL